MNDVNTLIDDLTGKLEPVKPLKHPFVRIAPWTALAVVYVGAVVYGTGLRPDIYQKLTESAFIYEMLLLGFTAISAALASAWLCVPDARGAKWLAALPLTSLGLFLAWMGSRIMAGEAIHMPHLHFDPCIAEGLLMIAVPITALLFLARRGKTTKPGLMVAMNVLAVGSLGYLGLRLVCYMDTIGHLMMYHFMPFLLIGLLAGLFARKIYRW